MKKLSLLVLLLFLAFSAFASSFEPIEITPKNEAYTYSGFSLGYGYTYIGNQDAHAVAFGFEAGHIFESFSPLQLGFAFRSDGCVNIGSNNFADSAFNLLFALALVIDLSDNFTLNLSLGPALNIQTSYLISIAAGGELNLEFKMTKNFFLKLGATLYGLIGINERAYGLFVSPYLGMTFAVSSKKEYFEKIDYLQ